ncbi:hypothetical protein IU443_23995 [Nocardia farcinica]|uniref:hypothetical protein n=1 Tax=Nocardia farcinica TaxID=37329 RepID=UPI001895D97E|nr:hypothetical protein [Nocardia farcinica]MBF6308619.1 hypothetical protein [Nocardia farcinica]MBF6393006.1 hypothetical protein [Nocardia farcinica]MBF6511256.1 hypothetical protein [Nocardia farcinica]MBF6527613.1 hypothetical protein [Nocardia farcinica]MBF6566347.1 hypothetical protein [Nocardia farcinica]
MQDDSDVLLEAALSLAEKHLAERSAFMPFALAVDNDGRRRLVEVVTDDSRLASSAPSLR